jgi:hypothetical protein
MASLFDQAGDVGQERGVHSRNDGRALPRGSGAATRHLSLSRRRLFWRSVEAPRRPRHGAEKTFAEVPHLLAMSASPRTPLQVLISATLALVRSAVLVVPGSSRGPTSSRRNRESDIRQTPRDRRWESATGRTPLNGRSVDGGARFRERARHTWASAIFGLPETLLRRALARHAARRGATGVVARRAFHRSA